MTGTVHNFTSVEFAKSELLAFEKKLEANGFARFTVSREVRESASKQLIDAARDLHYSGKWPMEEALKKAIERNPTLYKLAHAEPVPEKVADVVVC